MGSQFWVIIILMGLPKGSVGKESACNSIPGSGSSPGEEIGYPVQYSWTSLVAQMVENLPAMQETQVQSLGCEDLLEEGHSSILSWRIPMDRGSWRATCSQWGHQE